MNKIYRPNKGVCNGLMEITAEKCGVSVGEVRSGIAAAIDAGMESTSPEAAAFRKSVPRHG